MKRWLPNTHATTLSQSDQQDGPLPVRQTADHGVHRKPLGLLSQRNKRCLILNVQPATFKSEIANPSIKKEMKG
jgi:hypothetical protein